MSDYTIELQHTSGLTYLASNGRDQVTVDVEPDGGSWLPPELFLTGLGSCMLATLMAHGDKYGIDVAGARATVSGVSGRGPSRVARVEVTYELPAGLTDEEVDTLVRAGSRCKVHNTLQHRPEIVIGTKALVTVR